MGSPIRVAFASRTHVGCVRKNNQDAFGEFTDPERGLLLVLADGMGGHQGGEVASRLAVDVLGATFRTATDEPGPMLVRGVEAANLRIYGRALRDETLQGMGTTVVAFHLAKLGSFVAHVGDSRLYRLRAGKLEQLTADHSLVGELERHGYLTAEEAAVHPRRNELMRSVGPAAEVEVDIAEIDFVPGDRLLLCSDGLCGYVSDEETARLLGEGSIEEAAEALVEAANSAGGQDNVTVQVVERSAG